MMDNQEEEFEPKNAAYWKRQARAKDAEIKRLNSQVAMLCEAVCDCKGLYMNDYIRINLIMKQTPSDWVKSHDKQVRDAALEEAANHFNGKPSYETFGDDIAEEIRSMKGKP